MTGRNRTIIILAVVLIVLAGASFWLTSTPATPPQPTAEPTAVVWDFGSSTINGLIVQSITQTVALQDVNGNWKITAPVQHDADNVQVGQEAGQLAQLQARSKIGDNVSDADLASYGLASPALTVTLVLSGTTPQQQLLVGKTNLDGSAYYVRPAGSHTVSLVTNTTIEPLKTWLDSPPIAQPTATPLVPTILPTNTPTNTLTLTGTQTIVPPAASPANATATEPAVSSPTP